MSEETLLIILALGGAGAAAWYLLGTDTDPPEPGPVPATGPRLVATGDGALLAAASETRAALDKIYDDVSHCDALRRKGGKGKCAVKCRRCKKKVAKRKNKAIAEAGMLSLGTTRGALGMQVLGGLGSFVGDIGGAVGGLITGGGTTTAPGGAQPVTK